MLWSKKFVLLAGVGLSQLKGSGGLYINYINLIISITMKTKMLLVLLIIASFGTSALSASDTGDSLQDKRSKSTNYTLTIVKTGPGSGTVTGNGLDCGSSCSLTLPANTPVILTGKITKGSLFSGWLGNSCSGTGTCSFTLTSNTTILANFITSISVTQVPYQGLYVLGPGSKGRQLSNISTTDETFIDGYAMRSYWTDYDSGVTGPKYDFSLIDDAISQLQSQKTGPKKLSVNIDAHFPPAYVLNDADIKYQTMGGITTVAPWDAKSMSKLYDFMKALSSHQVYDVNAKKDVALKDHSAMAGIRIGLLGLDRIQGQDLNALVDSSIYDRTKLIAAVLYNLHVVQDQFPKTAVWIQYFSVNDDNKSYRLNDALLGAINDEFDGSDSIHPHVGLFESSLKGTTPDITGVNGEVYDDAVNLGNFLNHQACGAWITHSPPCGDGTTWPKEDNTPENGFNLGYGSYGSRYYELYKSDVVESSFEGMYQNWHDFLVSPTTAKNPINLSISVSGTKVTLTWNDTSTIELGTYVQRSTSKTGPWTNINNGNPLSPNVVKYVDTITSGTKYYYRVYPYGQAGNFIISNIVNS